MPAPHTRRAVGAHTDRQTSAMTPRRVCGPPGFSRLRQQAYLTEWRPLLTGLGLGLGTPFPQSRQPPVLRGWDVHSVPLRRKLPPAQTPSCFPAGPRVHTALLVGPEHRCYIYPSPLSWKCSLLPVRGSRTSPQMLCPMSESPSGKREASKTMQLAKKGKFTADASQGSRRAPSAASGVRERWAQAVAQFIRSA